MSILPCRTDTPKASALDWTCNLDENNGTCSHHTGRHRLTSTVDVGFVNQNSGFINQRFDNQGSTTKVRQLKTAVSSTKVRQPKGWIRQPKTADSSTKVRQPRFVNQKVGFVNQGFVNQKVGFVNQKRRIHQPRFVNQKHGFARIRQPKGWISSTKNGGFVNQVSSTKTTDSSTSPFRSTLNTGYITFGHV